MKRRLIELTESTAGVHSRVYVGVYRTKDAQPTWRAVIGWHGATHAIGGRFSHETLAARAYDCAALTLYGPHAAVNFGAGAAAAFMPCLENDAGLRRLRELKSTPATTSTGDALTVPAAAAAAAAGAAPPAPASPLPAACSFGWAPVTPTSSGGFEASPPSRESSFGGNVGAAAAAVAAGGAPVAPLYCSWAAASAAAGGVWPAASPSPMHMPPVPPLRTTSSVSSGGSTCCLPSPCGPVIAPAPASVPPALAPALAPAPALLPPAAAADGWSASLPMPPISFDVQVPSCAGADEDASMDDVDLWALIADAADEASDAPCESGDSDCSLAAAVAAGDALQVKMQQLLQAEEAQQAAQLCECEDDCLFDELSEEGQCAAVQLYLAWASEQPAAAVAECCQ